jgi:hypothetical protein
MLLNILLTSGKYLHDRIISLSGEVWAHKTTTFIEVPVASQESKRVCICMLGVWMLSLLTILIFDYN